MKRMIIVVIAVTVFFLSISVPRAFSAGVVNPDKPLKGEWRFKLQKEWQVDEAGDQPFAWIYQVTVSQDGTLYAYDRGSKINYMFDKQGKYKGSFGRKGEGPGEVKRQRRLCRTKQNVIIDDRDRVHFFTLDGEYLKSVVNKNAWQRPLIFLNQDEFISAPKTNFAMAVPKGKVLHVNLKTSVETLLVEFDLFKGGSLSTKNSSFSVHSPELTPAVIVHVSDDILYYGMSGAYEINSVSMAGKKLNSFSLRGRERIKVSKQAKKDLFKRVEIKLPDEVLENIVKTLPDETTFFNQIEVHNRLIYVYVSNLERKNSQQIDIFSPDGKYLYRSFIKVPAGIIITRNPFIIKDCIYLVLEDKEGNPKIARYKSLLPTLKKTKTSDRK